MVVEGPGVTTEVDEDPATHSRVQDRDEAELGGGKLSTPLESGGDPKAAVERELQAWYGHWTTPRCARVPLRSNS